MGDWFVFLFFSFLLLRNGFSGMFVGICWDVFVGSVFLVSVGCLKTWKLEIDLDDFLGSYVVLYITRLLLVPC